LIFLVCDHNSRLDRQALNIKHKRLVVILLPIRAFQSPEIGPLAKREPSRTTKLD
jgi:hypothetical protein